MTSINPQTIDQLREKEELFHALVEHMLDAVVIIDWDGTVQFANNAAAKLLGLKSREEAVGHNQLEFLHPDCVERAAKEMAMVKEGTGDFLGCYQLLIDGKTIDVESHGVEVQYNGRSADMVTFRDVTERNARQAQLQSLNETLEDRIAEGARELHKSERMFRAMNDSMQAMVMIVSVEQARAVYVNPAATSITGYSAEELTAAQPVNLFTEDSLKKAMQYREAWQRGEDVPRLTETEIITKSGQRRWLETAWAIIDLGEDGLHKVTVNVDITERKQAEQQLAESERKFRALAESTSALIAIAAPKENGSEFLYANESMLKTLGYTWEELQKMDSFELFTAGDEDQRKLLASLGERYRSGQPMPKSIEIKVRTKGGDEVWLESTGQYAELGGRLCDVSTSFDITERKRAEEQLAESEKKFKALAESTSARICISREDSGYIEFLYANKAFLDALGKTWNELQEQDPIEFCDPNPLSGDMPAGQKEWFDARKLAQAEERVNYSYEFQDDDGSWIQIHAMETTLDGKLCTIWTSFDISDQKRIQADLAQSEERYRAIFETTGTGTIIFEDDTIIQLANDEWAAMIGYSREEMEHRMSWTQFFTEESLVKMKEYHKQREKDPTSVPRAYEADIKDRNGKVYNGIITVSMVPGTTQRVGSFQNLTDLKRAQKQMYQADKMAALGQIVAGVAHEINNPNNFIYFNLPILRKYIGGIRPLLDAQIEQAPATKILGMSYNDFLEDTYKLLENMEHGSKRITSIVADLKNYVRSDDDAQMKPESLNRVINQVMTLVGKQVRKMVKHFDVETEDALPEVSMNAGKIEQVLINLIINAGQAADKDDSYVRLNAARSSNDVVIRVEDNGAGISESNMEQIFEPFFTSKGREAGTGLGLSISAKTIEDHGGTITVESEEGKGSCFTVRLPAFS